MKTKISSFVSLAIVIDPNGCFFKPRQLRKSCIEFASSVESSTVPADIMIAIVGRQVQPRIFLQSEQSTVSA
jgi:hypothetical protein